MTNKDFQCTECGKETNHIHCERWNNNLGFIIQKGERLCTQCASKREGVKTLSDFNKERGKH